MKLKEHFKENEDVEGMQTQLRWKKGRRKTERNYKNCNGSVKNLLREERTQGHETVRRSERIKESTKDDVSPG